MWSYIKWIDFDERFYIYICLEKIRNISKLSLISGNESEILNLGACNNSFNFNNKMVATRYIMDPTNLTEVIKG